MMDSCHMDSCYANFSPGNIAPPPTTRMFSQSSFLQSLGHCWQWKDHKNTKAIMIHYRDWYSQGKALSIIGRFCVPLIQSILWDIYGIVKFCYLTLRTASSMADWMEASSGLNMTSAEWLLKSVNIIMYTDRQTDRQHSHTYRQIDR